MQVYHEICQRSSKFHLKSKPMLPEKQSRLVFAQFSSAYSDGLRARHTSSQTLTVDYQTLFSNRSPLHGAFWCYTGQLHKVTHHSGTRKPDDWKKGK